MDYKRILNITLKAPMGFYFFRETHTFILFFGNSNVIKIQQRTTRLYEKRQNFLKKYLK